MLGRIPSIPILLLYLVACSPAERIVEPTREIDRIERQFTELVEVLSGKRVGLLTNPSGVDGQYRALSDRLIEHPDIRVVAFFAPEHGIYGALQAGERDEDTVDPRTGLPVYSLYGPRRSPTGAQLEKLDAVVFDMQSVGARFYTRQWLMTWAMEACARHGKSFVVFDRPNPNGLERVEGAPIPFDAGIIGRKWPDAPFGVPVRHGLTIGELAVLVNEEWMDPKVDLTVIKVPGLIRAMTFEETGYPWVIPTPNMPTIDTAFVFPGMCLMEGANVSEGRGTARPFEFFGAPWIDGQELAEHLNSKDLPGCRFRPAAFRPTWRPYEDELCHGVQVHVTDRKAFEPVRTGLTALRALADLYPEHLELRGYLSRLAGVENLHERIREEDVDLIIAGWQEDLAAFIQLRERYLLYGE